MTPQTVPHHGQGIRKRGARFAIPRGLAPGQLVTPHALMGEQGDQRKQTQQGGRGVCDRQVRPLALGFDPQPGATCLASMGHEK